MIKKIILCVLTVLLANGVGMAQSQKHSLPKEKEMGAYLMVYHKDCDHSLHMAISYDGYVWTALNNDHPIICGDTIAEQHGIRDPHIFRGPDGGFYLAMTDLHIFGSKEAAEREGHHNTKIYRNTEWERDGATYGWGNNRGLVLMKSFDLINWTRTNLDFSKLPSQPGQNWSEVGCVWAPETVYDEEKGQLLVHFTTRTRKEQGAIYCVYMNNDFTQMIGQPQLLFEAPQRKYTVIDSDIIKVGDTYHLFFVSHEKGATPVHATSKCVTGPYEIDTLYNDNEKGGHEAPNCWKRIGEDKYVLMFDNYSMRPHNFGFVETTDFRTFKPIGHFDEKGSPMKRTNFSEQKHGAVIWITKEEARRLEMRFQQYRIPVSEIHEQMQTGKYQPTWESLETHQTPEWFRDAKFGIWAHWGPQCVEGSGDWMAREMYMEGNRRYKYHVEHYGHPSEFGFKDILPLFKAEKWNPEALLEKYKRCGAQYFFALGNHHDNYDLWNSKYQPWNSQNIGPKRDVLDEWAKAAKKVGLPLGISFHADHAWTWYEPSQRYDLEGEKAGVYYDGNLTKEDGKGKWWEGLDPQMLYQQHHPMSKGSWDNGAIHRQWDWSSGACPPSKEFVTNFYDRTLDAINRYQPDLIYFDVTVLPFYPISDCGMKIAAHMYNKNPRGIVFGKILSDEQRKALTWDVERGAPNEIIPEPWQTCNCIGGWHYNTDIYEKGRYKSAATVVKQLVDIVSKNGNLLLSVPLRADGTYDEKEAAILDDLEAWMTVNGESIFGTRPWVKFGEGPVAEKDIKINAQGFNDGQFANMDARDIRFNQTKKHLYVTAMGWPEDGRLVIKSLAKGNNDFKRGISSVTLLGYGKLKVRQTAEGLEVSLPQPCNKIAPVLKIAK